MTTDCRCNCLGDEAIHGATLRLHEGLRADLEKLFAAAEAAAPKQRSGSPAFNPPLPRQLNRRTDVTLSVVQMHRAAGLSVEAIAAKLCCARATVEERLREARREAGRKK